MTYILAYDFETSGLPLFDKPSEDPGQPHIVQAAALLVNAETRDVAASFVAIVYPDGWEIPVETTAIHGITTDHAREVGIGEDHIVRMIWMMWRKAQKRVAHNISFDDRIMRIGMHRSGFDEATMDEYKAAPKDCTQILSTPILNLPPTDRMLAANRRGPKPANLTEAYEHFTGNKMVGAHGAMQDTRACLAVWFAIQAMRAPAGALPTIDAGEVF